MNEWRTVRDWFIKFSSVPFFKMKKVLFILSVFFCVELSAQDVSITCWFEKIDTNYCSICPDLKSYEVFTGIKVEFPDSIYRIYAPYKVYDEDTFYVIQDVYNTQIYIGENRVTYANKFEIAEAISDCLSDTSGAGATSVVASFTADILTINVNGVIDTANMCDPYTYFESDTGAYYRGRITKDEWYISSASHLEGIGAGIYKQVRENYGWEIFTTDSIYYGFNGLVARSRNTTRVGFDAAHLARCRVRPPAVDLQYYENDDAAIAAGLSIEDSYLLPTANFRGLPKDFIQRITP